MTDIPHQGNRPGKAKASSLADMVSAAEMAAPKFAVGKSTIIKIVVLAALFAAMNHWQFRHLVENWVNDPNWSHGFLIPLFSLYLLYARRSELLSARRRTCLWGLPIMIAGILTTFLGYYPIGNDWISQLSMTVVLFGMVLYLAGPAVIRIAWVPIFYLVLAMPIPESLYTRLAVPLQEFAAKSAAILLQLFNVQISVTASNLKVVSLSGREYGLTVAEACSGIRSLIAYLALGVAWAYLEYRPIWQRVILVGSAIPIAILLNIIRVAITCTMYMIDKPELGQDIMHELMGMVMLVPALALLWLLSLVLKNLFIEVDEEETAKGPGETAQ